MEQYLNKDSVALEAANASRNGELVQLTLKVFLDEVKNIAADIDAIYNQTEKRIERERGVRELITSVMEEMVRGRMTVTEYVEKNKSKQLVYLFLGTHWQLIPSQLYYVFVKQCAKRMGLVNLLCEDPEFMNRVIERLAYRCMEYKRQVQAPDVVYINVMNGTLEIGRDGTTLLREHRAEDFFTYVLPYVYDPYAECPLWHTFLDRVLPEKAMQTLLGEYIAYCFTKNMKAEKMAVLYGTGSNGKSVTLDIVSNLLGSSNVSNITLSALTTDDEKRALIEGKLANISHESNGQLDTAMLKQLISGEPTEVRVLYRGTHTMYDIPKLFTSYNRLPSAESTYGFFRRWLLFPFDVTIPEGEQDLDLVSKLNRELPGILNWVLAAMKGFVERKGFCKSEKCDVALKYYIRTSNSVLMFLDERCEISEVGRTSLAELYRHYTNYCAEDSLKRFGKKNFQEVLRNFGANPSVYHHATMYNIVLKSKEEDDDDKAVF